MKIKVYQIINYVLGLLPLGAVFGLVAFVANVEIKDLDLWLHLGVGKYITLSGIIPQVDIFSVSVAGKFWNNHEWLFQVLLYNVFDNFGADGLLKMQIGVVTVTLLLLLFIGYNRERQFLTTLLLLLVYLVYQGRFTIRPDIFSLLFFTIYIYVLALHIDKRWAGIVLVVVQIFWTNMHGFFFFGPLFVAIGLVSEWLKRHVRLPWEWNDSGRLTDDEYKRLKGIFVFVILACVVNPQGVQGAWYPISVFFSLSGESKIFFSYIQELQKPILSGQVFDLNRFAYYKLLIFISTISFILNRRKIDVSALLFWLVFLFFSLKAARNISFFAFAAYLVIITNCYYIDFNKLIPFKFTERKFHYITVSFLNLLLLVWILGYCSKVAPIGYYDFDRYERKSEYGGVSQRSFPQKAADFLVANNIKGNFFNDFNSGAYLIGRVYPNIRVFMDGRTELYGPKFFKEYLSIWDQGDAKLFEKYEEEFNLTGALLNSARQEIPEAILKYFNKREDWVPVYFDHDAIVFLKKVEQNQKFIELYQIDFSNWQPKKIDLLKLGSARVQPFMHVYRGHTLESLGYDEAAKAEVLEAIRIEPAYTNAYAILGKIEAKKKDYKKAFENFRKAAIGSPRNKKIRFNLALTYLDLGEYQGAIGQYKAVRYIWPTDPKAVFFLAKAYAHNQEYDEALKILKEAVQMAPSATTDTLSIGDVVFSYDQFDLAKDFYELAHGKSKKAEVYKKIAQCYQSMGDVTEAKQQWEEALALDPDNEEIKKEIEALK